MLRGYRHKLGKVFIVFTETNDGYDISTFVEYAMRLDGVDFIHSRPLQSGEDWRDVAVNEALNQKGSSKWVWFTEQDFFVNENFWPLIEEYQNSIEIMYVSDAGRMHPCCILAPRAIINQTSRRFGVVPNKLDHFGLFQKDIEGLKIPELIINGTHFTHMNGLSHNFTLMRTGNVPNYQKENFDRYLMQCLQCEVEIDKDWRALVENYLKKQ
jgi:hypothetical protein